MGFESARKPKAPANTIHLQIIMMFRLGYTAIRVRDLERSIAFYRGVLGLKMRAGLEFPENRGEAAYFESEGSGHTIEINWYEEGSPVAGPYGEGDEQDHLAFEVDSVKGGSHILGRVAIFASSDLSRAMLHVGHM